MRSSGLVIFSVAVQGFKEMKNMDLRGSRGKRQMGENVGEKTASLAAYLNAKTP